MGTVSASSGATTMWTGAQISSPPTPSSNPSPSVSPSPSPNPSPSPFPSYTIVAVVPDSSVGTSSNQINTNVRTVNGTANAGVDGGNIFINQTSGDMTVKSINGAGDVYLTSAGSIFGVQGVGTNVTSGGDTHLKAGDVIGSWTPTLS